MGKSERRVVCAAVAGPGADHSLLPGCAWMRPGRQAADWRGDLHQRRLPGGLADHTVKRR